MFLSGLTSFSKHSLFCIMVSRRQTMKEIVLENNPTDRKIYADGEIDLRLVPKDILEAFAEALEEEIVSLMKEEV